MCIKSPATSVKEKNELRNTGLLDKSTGCHRLPSLWDSKADIIPWYYNQQELSAHFFQYSDYTWLFLTIKNNMI